MLYNDKSFLFLRMIPGVLFLTVFLSPVPAGSGEMPTLDSIDSYMKKLQSIILSNPQENQHLISTVRDVVNRLDR